MTAAPTSRASTIVTLTPNPSIDATLVINEDLRAGAVHRATSVTRGAGGKGINVSRAVHMAGLPTRAVFPAAADDALLPLVADTGIPFSRVNISEPVRVNTTIAGPHGVTTKLNGPGPVLTAESAATLIEQLLADVSPAAGWVVLAGSLPQGLPVGFYVEVVRAIRERYPDARVAVDTSDAPLETLAEHFEQARPTLIKPNGLELGQIAGVDGLELECKAESGDFTGILAAARAINARGVEEVLVTLGGAGAVLVTSTGAWAATPPPTVVASTVGAGDSALAGYILARSAGADFPQALAQSVAYGSAAASLPGSGVPSPDLINIAETPVRALD